ncbi:band 3 anion transport protein-like isoform X2 [Ptychodera flava]|uniref:band 3 anion transport protein-like isoform X2 n=1 Tax=Ptychodera flava TaxID=63121 RepID=UPI003969D3D0
MPFREKKKVKIAEDEMQELQKLDPRPAPQQGMGRSASVVPKSTLEEVAPPWRRSSDADIVKMLTPKHSFTADISTASLELDKDTHYYDERDYQLHRRESLHHHSPFGHHHRSSGKISSRGSKGSYLGSSSGVKSLQGESSARSLEKSLPEEPEEEEEAADETDGSKPVLVESPKLIDAGVASRLDRDLVSFTLGGEPLGSETADGEEDEQETEGWLPRLTPKESSTAESEESGREEVVAKWEVGDTELRDETEEKVGEKESDVKITIDEAEEEEEGDEVPELGKVEKKSPTRRKHKHRRHHHRHHHRRHHHHHPKPMPSLEGLSEEGRDEELLIARHRFEEVPGMSRHLIRRVSSVMHPGRRSRSHEVDDEKAEAKKSARNFGLKLKKKFDHRPHEVFVELDELYTNPDGKMAWKEKARWIKFEEDVEEDVNRWGKPHVASLSFHSLLELRKGLEEGALILDLDERDISGIVHHIVEQMVITDQISESSRGDVLRALLMQHRHLKEPQGIFRTLSTSSLPSLRIPHSEPRKGMEKNFSFAAPETKIDMEGRATNHSDASSPLLDTSPSSDKSASNLQPSISSDSNLSEHMVKPSNADKQIKGIMRQIPPGAEATTVLVGAVEFLDAPCMAFVRLAQGAMLDNFTEVPLPVRFIFVLLGPADSAMDYTEIGRSISTLMANERFHKQAYEADERADLLYAINEFLDESIVLPPGDWNRDTLLPIARMHKKKMKWKQMQRQKDDESRDSGSSQELEDRKKHPDNIDPLKRTGCLFGGFINDVKRRYPRFVSDFKDGLTMQCFAALVFIYFAALSPAITFGGLLGEKTDKWMGVGEMIVSTAVCGTVFALLSGQPLIIVGATGPVLIFEEAVYQFCEQSNLEFLPFRAWVGIWVFLVTVIVVALEGSTLVRYFTRYTEEIFTALVALIFIYEVFKKLHKIYVKHPLLDDYCFDELLHDDLDNSTNHTWLQYSTVSVTLNYSVPPSSPTSYKDSLPENEPNTALLSTILTLGTFFIAYFLRKFKNGRFFSNRVRKTLGDFGVLIAIVIMVLVDVAIENVYTQKLEVPDGFTPTAPEKRGWFISPTGLESLIPVWAVFAAIIPAILVFILLYMETLITELIVNKKEYNLKKGSGYHLDLFLIGALVFCCSMFGLPWACCATVRSVSHVQSLTKMSKTYAPGERPTIECVIEQRLTALVVSILIGISLAMQSVMRQVPIAVLFGVFLYLGITSLSGIQFYERVKMLFMPAKHHPDVRYVRKVKTYRMHIYTILQLFCLGTLWAVKSTIAALAFPFVLILMVPVRFHVITKIFTQREIDELDSDEVGDDDEGWDEYNITHMPF